MQSEQRQMIPFEDRQDILYSSNESESEEQVKVRMWEQTSVAQQYKEIQNYYPEVEEMFLEQFPSLFWYNKPEVKRSKQFRQEEPGFIEIVSDVHPQMIAAFRDPIMDEEFDDEKQEMFDKFTSLTADIDHHEWWKDEASKLKFRKKFVTADQKIKQLEEQGKNDFQKLTILQDDLNSGRVTNPQERRVYNEAIKIITKRQKDISRNSFNNEERKKALELYKQGFTYQQIAFRLNKDLIPLKIEIGKLKFVFGQ